MLTTDQKGNIAEAAIVAAAVKLGIDVYRAVGEGGRYDMTFEVDRELLCIQCKWAPRHRDVVVLHCYSARRNREGVLTRKYHEGEIDAFAAYCGYGSLLLPAVRPVHCENGGGSPPRAVTNSPLHSGSVGP